MTTEGIDGKAAVFRERLWPSVGQWVFVLVMTSSLGIAYGRAYDVELGIVVGVAATIVIAIGLVVNTPLIQIDELNFRVGRARLPLQFVGKIQKLDEKQSRRARSTDANSNAHFQLRGGIKNTVIVEVTDPQDPHPYWQVSTRNPDELISALNATKQTA
jgi:hypothetical protein